MNRVRQAAVKLGIEESTLRSWILHRKINYVKIGRSIRISDDEIDRLIKESTVPARMKLAS